MTKNTTLTDKILCYLFFEYTDLIEYIRVSIMPDGTLLSVYLISPTWLDYNPAICVKLYPL